MKQYGCIVALVVALAGCSSIAKHEEQLNIVFNQSLEIGVFSKAVVDGDFIENNESDLNAFRRQVLSLYVRALREHRDLEGELVINLIIQPSGQVSYAKVGRTNIPVYELNQKILKRASLLSFSYPPKHTIEVSLPVVLKKA